MSGSVSIVVVILMDNDSLHLARALRHIKSFAEEIVTISSTLLPLLEGVATTLQSLDRIGPFRVGSRAPESSKESHSVAMDVGHVGSRTYWAGNGGWTRILLWMAPRLGLWLS